MNIRPFFVVPFITAASLLSVHSSMAQILQYDFDQTGVTAPSSGSNASGLTLKNSGGTDTDLHTASGTGVSGLPGDRALDVGASAMGNAGTGGYARTTSDLSEVFNGAVSLTVSGWFKADSVYGSGAKLVTYFNSTGLDLYAASSGNISLNINGTQAFGSGTAYGATGTWVFFAVTYDSSLASNQAKFYVGTTGASVSLAYAANLAGGALIAPTAATPLTVGNNLAANRPFDGLIDDINIYASLTNSSGALNLAQLESVRLSAVPEPVTTVLIGGGIVFAFFMSKKRRRY